MIWLVPNHLKITKIHFFNDPKPQKRFLVIFCSLVCWTNVCWSGGCWSDWHFFEKGFNDFLAFCMNIHIDNGKRSARSDFPKKFRIIQKSCKRARSRPFFTLIRFWRKTSLRNFPKAQYYGRAALFWEPCEKLHVRENSCWFLRIFFVRRVGHFEWSIQLLAIF